MHFQRFANPSIEICFLFRMPHNDGNGTEFKHIVRSVCHIMLDTERNLEYIYKFNIRIFTMYIYIFSICYMHNLI